MKSTKMLSADDVVTNTKVGQKYDIVQKYYNIRPNPLLVSGVVQGMEWNDAPSTIANSFADHVKFKNFGEAFNVI